MIVRELPHLAAAINEESWQWLQDNTPILADALAREIEAGATAEEVRQAANYLMAARNG